MTVKQTIEIMDAKRIVKHCENGISFYNAIRKDDIRHTANEIMKFCQKGFKGKDHVDFYNLVSDCLIGLTQKNLIKRFDKCSNLNELIDSPNIYHTKDEILSWCKKDCEHNLNNFRWKMKNFLNKSNKDPKNKTKKQKKQNRSKNKNKKNRKQKKRNNNRNKSKSKKNNKRKRNKKKNSNEKVIKVPSLNDYLCKGRKKKKRRKKSRKKNCKSKESKDHPKEKVDYKDTTFDTFLNSQRSNAKKSKGSKKKSQLPKSNDGGKILKIPYELNGVYGNPNFDKRGMLKV